MHQATTTGPLVTVIVPTFDHAETLHRSIPTALAQTHANLELLVVCDGSPPRTYEIVAEYAEQDDRVRCFRFEKGPRHGEQHRHELLRDEARGEWVFYLGDDDLWLPDHIERLLGWMVEHEANFGCCQPCWIMPDTAPAHRWVVDLAHPWYRAELLAGRNRVPLSCGAHSMQLYRALAHGWRTTPTGTPTDLYMWQQLLEHPACQATSAPWTTVIGVPASQRSTMDASVRLVELDAWSPTTSTEVRERFVRAAQAAEGGLLAHASYEAEYTLLLEHLRRVEDDRDRIADELARQTAVLERQAHELHTIYTSRGWRMLERMRKAVRR